MNCYNSNKTKEPLRLTIKEVIFINTNKYIIYIIQIFKSWSGFYKSKMK